MLNFWKVLLNASVLILCWQLWVVRIGLNLAIDLEEKGILREYNVQLLGTQIYSIKRAEDRELFKETMEKINQPIPESAIVETMAAAKEFARKVGFPLIVRPASYFGRHRRRYR